MGNCKQANPVSLQTSKCNWISSSDQSKPAIDVTGLFYLCAIFVCMWRHDMLSSVTVLSLTSFAGGTSARDEHYDVNVSRPWR